jgi:hypothetical protein
VFVISTQADHEIFAKAYAAAVGDLGKGAACSVIIETEKQLECTWIRALTSLRSCPAVAANPRLRNVA